MKATGKSTEAKELKKGLRTTDATRGISEKLDAAMQEGVKANREDASTKHKVITRKRWILPKNFSHTMAG